MKVGVLVLNLLFITACNSQELTRILFVFDASNSMSAYWDNEPKINTAVRLLGESVDELSGTPDVETALRVYGHQTRYVPGKQDCEDTELVVPFSFENNLIIKKALQQISPMGTTPIARSLMAAAEDFPDCANCRNIIILITDGIEACDEDPCAASRLLQEKGITLRPFVIGIGGEKDLLSTFDCVGKYFDASQEENFKQVLEIVLAQALNNTTVQVDLLDAKGAPTVSDVPMSFYNSATGESIHHFVHALDENGNPDTLALDPILDYDLKVHTLPPLKKKKIALQAGKHNTIELQAAQGSISFSFPRGRNPYDRLTCLVRKKDGCEVLHLQDFEEATRYLTGAYDVEISTIPPTILFGVEVKENETNAIQLPEPGTLTIMGGKRGYGGIFKKEGESLVKAYAFEGDFTQGRYTLQPGNYVAIFRGKNQRETLYTIEKTFEIKSGKAASIQF